MEVPHPEREVDIISDPSYLTSFNKENEIGLTDADRHHAIIPVDVEGSNHYVTGAYQDTGHIDDTYTVKVWLLIEEKPVVLHE